MIKKGLILLIFVCSSTFAVQVHADKFPPITNKDGSIVTGVLTANYDPTNPVAPVYPFPLSLLFTSPPTRDLTINAPAADPNDHTDPIVALNSLDGFSTVEKWVTTFSDTTNSNFPQPASFDPASIVPGQSVRVFQVTTSQFVVVTGLVRELTPGVDFTAVPGPGGVVAIVPLRPLQPYSSYMAVLTNDITDTAGNNATPSQTYYLTKRRTPWVDANGNSTYSLIPDATAQALEPQRQITQSMEFTAAAAGVNMDDIVLAWTVQTQSIGASLSALRSIAEPMPTTFIPTGMDTTAIGGPGFADISIGIISLPYYLGIPSAEDPTAFLTKWWEAEPGAYVPPFNQFGLDPTSTNITIANPFPVVTGIQTVPLIVATPSESSGFTKPENGWPIVIYQHGLTRSRVDVLGLADVIASVGYAVIAMDQPLHGAVPDVQPFTAPFFVPNTPFAGVANERTFDADLVNNVTLQPPPDGLIDASGSYSANLEYLQVARDNLRQAETDLSILTVSIPTMDLDGDGTPDLDASNISIYGHSAGGAVATPYMAVEPMVKRGYLNASPGSILRTLVAGSFGVRINAILAANGIPPGTPGYELFLTVGQTVIDSGDGINYSLGAAAKLPILFNEVIGDTTVPNYVAGAPLAGSEAQIRMMGLTSFSSSQANPDGVRVVSRFLPPAIHSSLIDPGPSPAATLEMQSEAASFVASLGTFVQVNNNTVLQPVVQVELASGQVVSAKSGGKSNKAKNRLKPVTRIEVNGGMRND
ncbi:MAG TPA: hypothetical protein VKN35_07400 [Xanthomonadales bacterium]|nr:hypothetical protein [Xanthomonadales bacterium]